jgi:hypothetical protein
MLLLEIALATFMIIDSNSTHKPTARITAPHKVIGSIFHSPVFVLLINASIRLLTRSATISKQPADCLKAMKQTAHDLLHSTVNAYYLADYAYIAIFRTNDDGPHVRVCRLQTDVILLPVKPFESHFTINHSNNSILIVSSRLWSNQSQIAIEDTCIDH